MSSNRCWMIALFVCTAALMSCNFTTTIKTAPKLKVPVSEFNQNVMAYAKCKDAVTYAKVTKSKNSQVAILCFDMKFDKFPPPDVMDSIGVNVVSSAQASMSDGTVYDRYEVKFLVQPNSTQTTYQTRVYYPR